MTATRSRGGLRKLVEDWAPPPVFELARTVLGRHFGALTFEGDFDSWDAALRATHGYDHPSILAKVAAATLKVKRGEAAFERDSVLFDTIEYNWPVVSALMWAASLNDGRLSVLDFGGSLGSAYFQHRRFFSALKSVRWGVVEQPHYVERGKAEIQDETLTFFGTIGECDRALQPNVILLGSVLQYLERSEDVLRELATTSARVMVIDRTPLADLTEDRITVQHTPRSIYPASYPFRIFSRERIERALSSTWKVMARTTAPERPARTNAGLEFNFGGLILHR